MFVHGIGTLGNRVGRFLGKNENWGGRARVTIAQTLYYLGVVELTKLGATGAKASALGVCSWNERVATYCM